MIAGARQRVAAGPFLVQPVEADLAEDVVGRRPEDDQVPLARRDGELERAVLAAGHDGARAPGDERSKRNKSSGVKIPFRWKYLTPYFASRLSTCFRSAVVKEIGPL